METDDVSAHLARIYLAAKKHGGWLTSRDIAPLADVAERTARAHCLKLVQAGVFDQAKVFPQHRYRLSALAEKRSKALVLRINRAIEILGLAHS